MNYYYRIILEMVSYYQECRSEMARNINIKHVYIPTSPYNNFITTKKNMMEFTPLDLLNLYTYQDQESPTLESDFRQSLQFQSDFLIKKDSDINTEESLNLTSSSEKQEKRNSTKVSSEQHNMIKHIINIMKKMVGRYIESVGNIYTKPIIEKTWKVFIACKNPTRKILKAMFDRQPSKKLIEQMGFISILNQYGLQEYLLAMQQLREEVVFRMSGCNLKKHLTERQIQRKDRLAAYAEYFIKYEIKRGVILQRTTEESKRIIQTILSINKQGEDIDIYLN